MTTETSSFGASATGSPNNIRSSPRTAEAQDDSRISLAALDAGADPVVIGEWIAHVQAERASERRPGGRDAVPAFSEDDPRVLTA